MYASGNYVIIGSGNNLCVWSAQSYYLYKLVYTVNYTHDRPHTNLNQNAKIFFQETMLRDAVFIR